MFWRRPGMLTETDLVGKTGARGRERRGTSTRDNSFETGIYALRAELGNLMMMINHLRRLPPSKGIESNLVV